MKKALLVICLVALVTCLTGIPYLIEGIRARGASGVNYGRVIFPLIISGISWVLYRTRKKS